ncbi:hypothetical protein [Rhizobium rhizophilum]|uniref:Uncharacterized protein n=1 Tax=Rhizobium rhizophilum TaxID=1850373 RepID=A0ABY2QT41_9HYPH|nr:hypothetical protein [Rhizobium rhizophilum]THV13725.1 hypothetical protein E9677_12495 [Rhizobium rhizophilum]
MTVPKMSEVARDFVTDGVPSSGSHEIRKSQLRSWGTFVENMIDAGGLGGATWKATRSGLNADLAYGDGSLGVVYDDSASANNGLYVKVGASGSGSWSQITTFLPGYQFVTATDTESVVNAFTMETNPRLPFGDGAALVEFVVPITNTSGTVTISFDGDPPLTIKTASGNSPAVGGLIAGMPVSGVKIGEFFFMRSDQASAALLTQIEGLAVDVQEIVDEAEAELIAAVEPIRDAAQAAATEALAYAVMVGAAVYDFNFDSDPATPGYDWND